MLIAVGLVLLGLVLLVMGGEALVRGASGVALEFRLSPTVVGLTVVAAGTSMPELVVSLQAAMAGAPAMAVGNVVGSNIFNVTLIVGVAALLTPLLIASSTVKLEWPMMMLSMGALWLLARDGGIDPVEGGFFVAALVAFMAFAVWNARRLVKAGADALADDLETASFGRTGRAAVIFNTVAIAIGVALLVGGSDVLVRGAVDIARYFNVSDAVIGLTVLAAGTSLPELAATGMAALRGRADMALGNVIGSNIFNVLGIAGLTAIVHPLPVPEEVMGRDMWFMLGSGALLLPMIARGKDVTRLEGGVLLGVFAAYMAVLFQSL